MHSLCWWARPPCRSSCRWAPGRRTARRPPAWSWRRTSRCRPAPAACPRRTPRTGRYRDSPGSWTCASRTGFPVRREVTSATATATDSHVSRHIMCRFLTSIVVTISVLLASVSDALRSRDVEFMANVLLEYQMPICPSRRKTRTKRRGGWRKEVERGVKIQISRPKLKNEKVLLYFRDYFNRMTPNRWHTSAKSQSVFLIPPETRADWTL